MGGTSRIVGPAGCAWAACVLLGAAGAPAQVIVQFPAVAPPAPAEQVNQQPPPELPEADLAARLGELNSPDLEVRDRATTAMRNDPRWTLGVIGRVLTEAARNLTLEQRVRLMAVGRERFMTAERAALGFMFGGQLQDRVVVGQTYPKFPAHKVLEPGDVIIQADGVELVGPLARPALQAIIVSRDPGDDLPMVVRRGKQKLELKVPLGRFGDLEQPGFVGNPQRPSRPQEDLMARAWKVRARMLSPAGTPIDFAPAWTRASREERDQRRELFNKRLNAAMDRPSVQGGGSMRVGLQMETGEFPQVQFIRQNPQLRAIRQQGFVMFNDPDDESQYRRSTPAEELSRLAEAKMQAQRDLQRVGNDDDANPNESNIAQRAEALKRLLIIERQWEAIEQEIRERGEQMPVIKAPQVAEPGVEEKP